MAKTCLFSHVNAVQVRWLRYSKGKFMVICVWRTKNFFSFSFCLEIINFVKRFNRHLHAQCDINDGKKANEKIPKEEKFERKVLSLSVWERFCLIWHKSFLFSVYNSQLFAYQFFETCLLSCFTTSLRFGDFQVFSLFFGKGFIGFSSVDVGWKSLALMVSATSQFHVHSDHK